MNNFKYKLGDMVTNIVNDECGLIIDKFEVMPGCRLYRIDRKQGVWDENFIVLENKSKQEQKIKGKLYA